MANKSQDSLPKTVHEAIEGRSPPVPIEIMVFLILGWLFVLMGDCREMRLKKS